MRDLAAVATLTAVSKRLGSKPVLDGLSLGFAAGEVTALLGPNGAGKTTSVSLLTGRLRPDAGEARLFGLDPSRPAARARLGVMLQAAGLPDVMTVAELVTLQSGYYRDARPLAETLALAGLSDLAQRRCGALSGGQARRVQYALAICGRPDLLVLDEPTAAMDRASARALWSTVRQAAADGAAVLMTTHDLGEADALADRVVVMDAGRIVADDTPAAIRAQVGGSVIRCRTILSPAHAARLPGVRDAGADGAELRLGTIDAVATVRALVEADPALTGLRIHDASLEDAIAALLSPPFPRHEDRRMNAQSLQPAALPTGIWRRECLAEVRRSWRLPQFLLPTVVTPAAFYGLFTLAIARSPSPAAALASLAGYGVFAAIGPSLFGFGAGVAMEREQGLIELKRVSPMPAGAYVAAKLSAAAVATGMALVLIYALGLIAGATLSMAQWALLAALHLASTIPFALIGFGIGMRMSAKGAVAVANALFLGSAVVGGLWIPSAMLPAWMRALGEAVPSYHLGQLARAIVGADTIGSMAVHAAATLAMTAVAAVWAWTGWRRSPA